MPAAVVSDSGDPDGTVIGIKGSDNLHKIVILNPKGGCGKTTLATNLASLYALRGASPTLIDCDPQGFGMRWLEKRSAERPAIFGVRGYREPFSAEDSQAIDVPAQSSTAIIDLPAGIPYERLHVYTHLADSLLLPVQPSEIDVYAATRFVAELLLDVQLDRSEMRLAIVANRVRSTTRSYQMLLRFLTSLKIPMIASLRDSQSYVQAAAEGLGVCELPAYKVKDDVAQLESIAAWVERRRRKVTKAQREAMIARAAYEQAARRAFAPGDPLADWLNAEREVDARLGEDSG